MVSSSGRDSEPRRPAYPGTAGAASPRDSWFAASPVTGEQPASHPPPPPAAGGTELSPVTGGAERAPVRPPHDRLRTVLVGAAAILIVISVIIMIAVLAAGPSMAVIHVPRPAAGPPWWFSLHPSTPVVTFALWAAAGTGGLGVIAGLIAAARGARFPARSVAIFSFLVIGILTVLPVGGSTDVISYAANGRMAVIGHSPYVQTPEQLKNSGDPIGQYIPPSWSNNVSVYGPVATAEEWAAAELGSRCSPVSACRPG